MMPELWIKAKGLCTAKFWDIACDETPGIRVSILNKAKEPVLSAIIPARFFTLHERRIK